MGLKRSAPLSCAFRSPRLGKGLFSCTFTLLQGQPRAAAIKAELLTPVPKKEAAYCVAADSRHNEPQSESDAVLLLLVRGGGSDPVISNKRLPPFIGFLSRFHIHANEVGEEFTLERFGR